LGGDKLWHKLEKMLEIVQEAIQNAKLEIILEQKLITLLQEVVKRMAFIMNVFFLVRN